MKLGYSVRGSPDLDIMWKNNYTTVLQYIFFIVD